MTFHATAPQQDQALRNLRELLHALDPEAIVLVDECSGEVLVRGNLDATQVYEAVARAGLRMRVVDRVGSDCGCGCGCG